MRYETLAELRDAYSAGEVTGPLMIDNDSAGVYREDGPDNWVSVFEMHPAELLLQALDLLGVPHEGCER